MKKTRKAAIRPGGNHRANPLKQSCATCAGRLRLLAFAAALFFLPGMAAHAGELAIVGAKVYQTPDSPPLANATVLTRDGVIVAVGPAGQIDVSPDAQVIEGKGRVVVAGLWNSHVHLLLPSMAKPPEENAEALSNELESMFTRWGFTTVFDLASLPGTAASLRDRIESGEVRGPHILTVDAPIFPKDGTPVYVRPLLEGLPSMEAATTQHATERTRQQLENGADGIKIFTGAIVGGPAGVLPMPVEIASAVVAEAGRHGKPAFAHPSNQEGLGIAIESGVDILAHTTPDDGVRWSKELIGRMTAKNMALTPTLTLWRVESEAAGLTDNKIKDTLAVAQQQLGAFSEAGGDVLFGTDAGYIRAVDTSEEFRLMQGAGMSFEEILASLTTAPAARFKAENKGTVQTGMDADLAVLAADPAEDIEALANVAYTIKAGRVIFERD